jgi:putative sterol carrier protein
MASFEEVVATMSQRVGTLKSFGKKIKFSLDGNIFVIDGTANPPAVSTGDGPADTTVTVTLEDFAKLMDKKLNPMIAFSSGKVRLTGDLKGATALQKIF